MAQREMDQRIAALRAQGLGPRAAGEQAYREALAAATDRHYGQTEPKTETPARWGDDPNIGWN